MYHTLANIADLRHFNPEKFAAFARTEGKKFLTDGNGTVSMYTDELCNAYKAFRGAEIETERHEQIRKCWKGRSEVRQPGNRNAAREDADIAADRIFADSVKGTTCN